MRHLHTPAQAAAWLRARVARDLRTDDRGLARGDALLAWPGARHDARAKALDLLQDGAAAVLMEADGLPLPTTQHDGLATYSGLKRDAGAVAAAFYGDPSADMQVLAVTGTNGKTSITWWLAHALSALGTPCAVCGTLGLGVPGRLKQTGLTTPDPVQLQRELAGMRAQGVRALAIEASSVGLAEGRLAGLHVDVAVFTNLTQDHLDYHGDMESYWQAKARLFSWPGLRAGVVNLDDRRGERLARGWSADGQAAPALWTFSLEHPASVAARAVQTGSKGMRFEWCDQPSGHMQTLECPVVGSYNVANLLAVAAALRALGHPPEAVGRVLPLLPPVPGRMEAMGGDSAPLVVVDYAHTPDALEQALLGLQSVRNARRGRLHVVFGCGGDRDPGKRPLMGAVADARADQVHVTSDNPRSERPEAIVSQILLGLARPQQAQVEPDRARAIAQAIAMAAPADVVLVAGKGHEDYQEVNGQRLPFEDRAHARRALQAWMQARPMMSLDEAVRLLQSRGLADARCVGAGEAVLRRVHTDTRSVEAGDLFVALRGERFDGHDYAASAVQAGATAVLAEHGRLPPGVAGIEVSDTRFALGHLAAAWRSRWTGGLVAVTGSNGKTTVTQMVASILRAHADLGALATQGNLNNDIGLPLTLLRLRPWHRVGVVELGMNHPGEIAYLAELTRPKVALVNNAQREHQEFMHSVEAVARENGSVLQWLEDGGVAVFPSDDAFAPLWQDMAQAHRQLAFGGERAAVRMLRADWKGQWVCLLQTPEGILECGLRIAGRHNLHNALAAVSCALALQIPLADIAMGLNRFEAVAGRSRALPFRVGDRDVSLIDDCYNANPDSVAAAIDVLAELPGPRVLVLGDMGEVGEQGPAFHADAGALARQRGIEHVLTLGELSRHCEARHFERIEDLIAATQALLPQVSSVLIKGSRFMKMERVLRALQDANQREGADGHAA